MPESGSKTLFEQGIQEGNIVHVTYEEKPEFHLQVVEIPVLHQQRHPRSEYEVQVNHDWDGHMKVGSSVTG